MTFSAYKKKYQKLFKKQKTNSWQGSDLETLLNHRMAKLGLSVNKSTLVKDAIKEVLKEWDRLGFSWRPSFWFSDEWFYAEGTSGIAIPFYLSHPDLMALQRHILSFVEGRDKEDVKKYIRHELGHLLDYAYRWRFDLERRKVFGLSSIQYPQRYFVKPNSKKYVRNLPAHYAQSHPDEDLAETFAIYLKYSRDWKKRYTKGTIFKKLSIIDRLVKESNSTKPKTISSFRPGDIRGSNLSLKAHYLRRGYEQGMSYEDIGKKMSKKLVKDNLAGFRSDIKKYLASVKMPVEYKKYLLHRYYSPLFNSKTALQLWTSGDKKALRKFVQTKPLLWLKNGPFFYT